MRDQFAERCLGGGAPLFGDDGDLDGPLESGGAESLEHLLDLAGRVLDPAGLPGGEEQLLLFELEREELQELALTPEHGGQFVHAHDPSNFRLLGHLD